MAGDAPDHEPAAPVAGLRSGTDQDSPLQPADSSSSTMLTALGAVELRRGHTPVSSPLRAWSAADILIVDDLASVAPGRLLIVNDAWGALSVPTARWSPTVWADSALARWSIDQNLHANGEAPLADRAVAGDVLPGGCFDTVALSVPKSAALLRHQVAGLARVVTPASRVIVGGMSRHLTRSVFDALGGLGEPVARRAVRKARLIDVGVDTSRPGRTSTTDGATFRTAEGVIVHQGAGVFSSGHLDVGSALLLDVAQTRTPELSSVLSAEAPVCLDLGCGNGVIGASLARRWPSTTWRLRDVSDLAVASARATWQANGLDPDRGDVAVGDVAADLDDGSVDLVVTNPPFHQGHAVDSDLTARVLADARRVLRDDGLALVVAQRHLRAHVTLRRFFAQVNTVSSHPTHVVMQACRPRPARRR